MSTGVTDSDRAGCGFLSGDEFPETEEALLAGWILILLMLDALDIELWELSELRTMSPMFRISRGATSIDGLKVGVRGWKCSRL
jgi:hypothetical protein